MLVLKEEFIKLTYFFELQPFCYSSEVMIPDDPLVNTFKENPSMSIDNLGFPH